jgi:hypothetical protein
MRGSPVFLHGNYFAPNIASKLVIVMSKKRFKVSDHRLNSYGFYVLTSGIDTTDFKNNPVLLYNHNRYETMPSGSWEDLTVEGEDMFATPVIDAEGTEFDKDLAGKVERGVLRAASIGITILEWSDDPKYLQKGQTMPTVIKCQLREISICDIPSNKNAICLFDKGGKVIELSDDGEGLPMPKISATKKLTMDKKLLTQLGLSEDASPAEIGLKVAQLFGENKEIKAQLAEFKRKELEQQELAVEAELDLALTDNRINATQRPMWKAMLTADFTNGTAALKALGVTATIKSIVEETPAGDIGLKDGKYKGKSYDDFMRTPAEFKELKDKQPEVFGALFKARFGTDYKK